MSLDDVMQEVGLQEVSSGAVLALVAVIQTPVVSQFSFTRELFSTQLTLVLPLMSPGVMSPKLLPGLIALLTIWKCAWEGRLLFVMTRNFWRFWGVVQSSMILKFLFGVARH